MYDKPFYERKELYGGILIGMTLIILAIAIGMFLKSQEEIPKNVMYLKFNLSKIPEDAVIEEAKICVYVQGNNLSSCGNDVRWIEYCSNDNMWCENIKQMARILSNKSEELNIKKRPRLNITYQLE